MEAAAGAEAEATRALKEHRREQVPRESLGGMMCAWSPDS